MSETETIDKILQGEKQNFGQLVTTNNELLYRIGMSYINNHAEVEDLMQVAYIKAYQNLHKFNNQASFSTWIARIMINECLMHIRNRKRKLKYITEFPDENKFDVPDEENIETQINYEELKAVTEKILLQLPDEYRVVFVLRELQKFSTKEVAEVLGLTEENVKVRMFRVRRMLQRMLLKYFDETDLFNYDKKYCAVLTSRVMQRIFEL